MQIQGVTTTRLLSYLLKLSACCRLKGFIQWILFEIRRMNKADSWDFGVQKIIYSVCAYHNHSYTGNAY